MSLKRKSKLLAFINKHGVDYPAPLNLTYFWGFGSAAGLTLVVQILTGVFLAMHYNPSINFAFNSVEHIMTDVSGGWWIRHAHANGASMFFIVVYCHIFRGLYYGSYIRPRAGLWASGIAIFIIMMLTAFIGYVLCWGQMSYWGATVITKLVSVIPYIGDSVVFWLWGGYSVDNATLNRFFSLHYLFPFVLVALATSHLAMLHLVGSNNPLGHTSRGQLQFHPNYTVKDAFVAVVYLIVFGSLLYFDPTKLGDSENFIPAIPFVTPHHIVPEWYFLPFYAILRSIPDKIGGVLAMGGALIILFTVPYTNFANLRGSQFRPYLKLFLWVFLINFLVLGWIGNCPPIEPFITYGRIATVYYFSFFIIILPFLGILEKWYIQFVWSGVARTIKKN